MKLINPENSYGNNIAGKIGPVINDSYLSEKVANWLIDEISSVYENDLDQALYLAYYIKFLSGNEATPEDFTLFNLLLAIKGYIHSPNLSLEGNKTLEENILAYLLENYSPDFNLYMNYFIKEKEERLLLGGLALSIETRDIAVFLLKEHLIDYTLFIKIDKIPMALYQLSKNGNEWSPEDFTIEQDLFDFVKSWGFWMSVLRMALPEGEFEDIYSQIDGPFLEKYLKKESGKILFKYTNTYFSNILEVADYPSSRHILAPLFSWLFDRQRPYFMLLLDEFNRIQFDNENLKTLLRSAHIAYRYHPEDLPEVINKELTILSQRAIGNYRSFLKKADYTNREYLKGIDTVNEAINFLCYFNSPAEAIKQLVQLLRNLEIVTIHADLSFLPKQTDLLFGRSLNPQEYPDQEPQQNGEWIIAKMEWIISTFFELGNSDVEFTREHLAKFFGSRLKTGQRTQSEAPQETDLIEPNPIWRASYLSCIRALHCNPGGKLHQIINFSRNSDPDEDVRSEAQKAYKEIRHNNPLPSDMERILTIRRVFWYLRQAYYVSLLGIEKLDTRGAQRTYSKEVERCKARMKK